MKISASDIHERICDFLQDHGQEYFYDVPTELKLKGWEIASAVHLCVRALVEKREVVEVTEPYRGTHPGLGSINKSNLDLWQRPVTPPESFRNSRCSWDVAGSAYVCHCWTCSGVGLQDCGKCSGTAKVPCSRCNTQGRVACSHCSGSGQASQGRDMPVVRNCSCTGGRTYSGAICSDCNGCGQRTVIETFYDAVTCGVCQGTGRLSCRVCEGSGQAPCENCQATGRVRCKTCAGTTRLQCFLRIHQRFEIIGHALTKPLDPRDEEITRYIQVPADCTPILQSANEGPLAGLLEEDCLEPSVRQVVQRAIADEVNPGDGKVVRYAATLYQAEFARVDYVWRGHPYQAYLVGPRLRLCASHTPLVDVAKALLTAGLAQWARGNRLAAVCHTADALALSHGHRETRLALLGVQVPPLLRSMARLKRWYDRSSDWALSAVVSSGTLAIGVAALAIARLLKIW